LGLGPEISRVAEHLGKWDISPDDLGIPALLHTLDAPAPPVEVADHITHEFLGRHDLDRHDRLEQDRLCAPDCLAQPHRAGDLESPLRGIDVMERSINERDANVDYRVARLHA